MTTLPHSLLEAIRQRRRFSWLPTIPEQDRRGLVSLERRLKERQTAQRRRPAPFGIIC